MQKLIFSALIATTLYAQGAVVRRRVAVGGGTPPTISQTCTADAYASSAACSLSGNVTSGHYVAVFIFWNTPTTVTLTSVTAPCVTGNFSIYNSTTDSYNAAWAVGLASSTGACSPTATLSGTNRIELLGFDIAGSSGRDVSAMSATSATGTPANSPSVTTTAANDLVIGVSQSCSGNAITFGVLSPWSQGISGPNAGYTNMSETQTLASAGSVAASFTANPTWPTHATGVIAFKP